MVLEAEVRDGRLELVVNTALGAVSLAMSPQDVAKQVLTAAQAIQEASIAAGECEEICGDLQTIAVNRLPIVCELLHLGQLFPESRGVTDLNAALLRCIESVCNALHKAQTAMYSYLQCSKVERMLMASNSGGKLKKDLKEIRVQLTGRFNEVDSYMALANLLRTKPGAEPALHTAGVVAQLRHRLAELSQVSGAGKDRVKAIAKAALARQAPQGQKIRVSSDRGVMAVSPCGSAFATAAGHAVAVWDAVTGDCTKKMHGHAADVSAVAWSADGSLLATGCEDNTAAVWDMATGTRMHELRGHGHWVESVAWSPGGSFLATGSTDRTAAVWDMATGSRVHEPQWMHTSSVNAVAWSPDGSRVATGADDRTAVVWDVATGTRMHELRGHSNDVLSVAWSPDGSRLATGSRDNNAAVWDVGTGARMHELQGHSKCIHSVAWSPDGSRLVTGGGVDIRHGCCVGCGHRRMHA